MNINLSFERLKKLPVIQWLVRASLVQRIRGTYRVVQLAKQQPCKVVVGSMGVCPPGWIQTEITYLNLLQKEDWRRCFVKNSINAVLAEHVWEHLTLEEGIRAAQNVFPYLVHGGYLRVAVPDGFHPDPQYINWVKPGGNGYSARNHRVLYTYKTFKEIFELAGYKVDLLEYYDENGEFHYKEWNPEGGMIHRSKRFDKKKREGIRSFTSIILDACKE